MNRKILLGLVLGLLCSTCVLPRTQATEVNVSQYLSYLPGAEEAAIAALTSAAYAEADYLEAVADLALMTQNFGKYYNIATELTAPVIGYGAYEDSYNQIIADYDSTMASINAIIDTEFGNLVAAIQAGNWYNVRIASENLYEQFWYAYNAAIYSRGLVCQVRNEIRADCLNHPNGPPSSITDGDPWE